jgi:hypothetical protein
VSETLKTTPKMSAVRLVLRRGRERKVIVVSIRGKGHYIGPKIPKLGEEVWSDGVGWKVSKVEKCEVLLRIPITTATRGRAK